MSGSGIEIKKKFKEIVKDTFWYGISGTLARGLSIFLVPIYTKIFSPGDYGVIQGITIFISALSLFSNFQLHGGLFRYYYQYKEKNRLEELFSTVFIAILILSLFSNGIILFFSKYISAFLFKTAKYHRLITLAIITNFFSSYINILSNICSSMK